PLIKKTIHLLSRPLVRADSAGRQPSLFDAPRETLVAPGASVAGSRDGRTDATASQRSERPRSASPRAARPKAPRKAPSRPASHSVKPPAGKSGSAARGGTARGGTARSSKVHDGTARTAGKAGRRTKAGRRSPAPDLFETAEPGAEVPQETAAATV